MSSIAAVLLLFVLSVGLVIRQGIVRSSWVAVGVSKFDWIGGHDSSRRELALVLMFGLGPFFYF